MDLSAPLDVTSHRTVGRQTPLGWALRYGLAMAAVAVALAMRVAFTDWVGEGLPTYITFYPAVMAAALLAGFGPGLAATAFTGLVVAYHVLPPAGFAVGAPADRLGLAIFGFMGVFMSLVAEFYRRSRDKAAAYDREAALRESHARLATFAEATFEGIVESDAGKIVDCNEQLARMLGYSVAELKGMEIACFVAPEDRDRVMANIRHGRESAIEHASLRKDGTRLLVESHGRSVTPGGPRRHTVVRDITERKQVENALRFLAQCGAAPGEDFFRELAKYLARSLGMDYVCIDRLEAGSLAAQTLAIYFDGTFDANVSYALKDTPCGDVVGKRICCFPNGVRHLFAKDFVLQEMLAESYVGTTLWSSQGKPIGLIAVIGRKPLADPALATSILQLVGVRAAGELERKEAEEAMVAARISAEQAKAAADDANKAKDQFLAVLSHELRTPLAPVLLTVSLMEQRKDLPADLAADMQTIRRSIELEARIIDDLLDLTRIARGKMGFDMRDIDVHLLVRSATEICSHGDGAPIVLELSASRHIVHGDAGRLQQVLWNLLTNARKFTSPDGRITVRSTDAAEGRIGICVEDTGSGIEPELLPKIFDAFEQGSQSRRHGGLGLGLAISRAIVGAHGGTIEARSDGPGRGSTFTMELVAMAPVHSTAPASRPEIPPQRPLSILLVEDHEFTRKVMNRLIVDLGHTVFAAGTVAAAKELAGREAVDVVISDLGLPDGTGHELMAWLRQRYGLRGIALSGYGMEEDIQRSREAGFMDHLTKPVDAHHLGAAIARLGREVG